MKRILAGILILVLVIVLAGCGNAPASVPDATLEPTVEEPKVEPEPEITVEEVEAIVPDVLPSVEWINTYDTASMTFVLAKGEILNVRMDISPWEDRGNPADSFIFKILNQWHRVELDAGRVSGVYEFSFTADRSGKYIMSFDDDRGHVAIIMHHDYQEK